MLLGEEELSFLTISNFETIFWERRVLMVEEQCTVPEIVNVLGAQSELLNVLGALSEMFNVLGAQSEMLNVRKRHCVS